VPNKKINIPIAPNALSFVISWFVGLIPWMYSGCLDIIVPTKNCTMKQEENEMKMS
jgi:hypothetical protein